MKYPFRVNIVQNGVVWNTLIRKQDDLDYFKLNGYVIQYKNL